MARKRHPQKRSLQCATLSPSPPRCSGAGKYGGEVDVVSSLHGGLERQHLRFCNTFGSIFGPLSEPFGDTFPTPVRASNRCHVDSASWSHFGPGSEPPRCSGAGNYRCQLDVAFFVPGTLSDRSQGRNRLQNGLLGELIWDTEEGPNSGMKKEAWSPHP